MSFQKEVLIDGRGHLKGRLASIVAKELLNGQKVTVVRCEEINISNSLYRQQLKYQAFKRLTNNVNPKHGPFHQRAPSKMFWRVVRGMIPHKTARGAAALDRLKVFEGMPHPYDMKKKQVCPQALAVLRIKPYRKICRLGDLSKRFGWKCTDLIKKLEDKRRARASTFFSKKLAVIKKKGTAIKAAKGKLLKGDDKALYEKCVV
eukprot:g7245.t1